MALDLKFKNIYIYIIIKMLSRRHKISLFVCCWLSFLSFNLSVCQVVLVRWNEPFQKLATCDTDGGIFVWIQYEGRWSVELVNDRGAQVNMMTVILLFVLFLKVYSL